MFRILLGLSVAFGALTGQAIAAPITQGLQGEFWDQDSPFTLRFIGEVEAFVGDPGNTPDATFRSTEINYPRGRVGQNPTVDPLDVFLDDDFASFTLTDPTASLGDFVPGNDFIIRLTGFIELDPGQHSFTARIDDGLLLTIAGQEIFRARVDGSDVTSYQNPIQNTVTLPGGRMPIELIYFDNAAANFGLLLALDGKPVGGSLISTGTTAVPLPAPAVLLLGALGLMGLVARRRLAQNGPSRAPSA